MDILAGINREMELEGLIGDLGIAHKDDVILAITKSGESDELIALLPSIRRIGARLISITAVAKFTLARHSNLVLLTPVEEEACTRKSQIQRPPAQHSGFRTLPLALRTLLLSLRP